ncbi:MAG: hypothetical protein HY617_01365 [Candidatus Sungbacteria bacterium]|nr:hypothetical protein [Candidatus Sungbacteria bacterium]
MDILSHGLWGSFVFGRRSKKSFSLSFLFGMMPDLLSFGIFWLAVFAGLNDPPDFAEPPASLNIPHYVSQLYQISHSFVIFLLIFFMLWAFFRRPVWEFSAWGLHILLDIPTHSYRFFPTPFLWPVSRFEVDGFPWSMPQVFIPNILLLVICYVCFFIYRRKSRKA